MSKRSVASYFIYCILAVIVLSPSVLFAAGKPAGDPESATVPVATMATELDAMKAQIEIQRKQIEQLQSVLARQQQALDVALNRLAGASAEGHRETAKVDDLELAKGELEAVAESAAQANQRITKIETDTAAYTKSNDSKVKQVGNFSFGGDLRARFEPFFQEGAVDRNRERFRLRFNITAKITDEFSGGFSLATGSLDDPVSTNQTFSGFLNRKSIGIDRAYVSYKPKYAKFLKLDAGKFAFPWYRTAMTFDNDVNPEGFAQTLSFDVKSSSSPLRSITFVGFQLPLNEVSGGPDSFILGGQIQTQFRLTSKARLALYGAGLNFLRTDPLGIAAAGRTSGVLVGSLNNSNSLRRNSSGAVVGYATKFTYLDAILRLELDTNPRFPTTVLFNFVNNVRGPRDRSGYWAELTFGKLREVKDLQLGYTYIKIEKDAVIAAFNESDLRSSTNVMNHRLQVGYLFHNNVTGQFTAFIGKLASPLANTELIPAGVRGACTGTDVSSCRDPYLKRLQFDLIYKF